MPSFKRHKVLNNALATIVKQFVNVRWQTLATVLPSTMSQQCQRCFIKVITTMSTVLPSQLQSSMCRPPFPLAQTKIDPCMFWSRRDLVWNNSHLALPASRHAVEESSLCQGSGSVHGPSIVLGKFVQFFSPARLVMISSPLAPTRPSRCRCVRG